MYLTREAIVSMIYGSFLTLSDEMIQLEYFCRNHKTDVICLKIVYDVIVTVILSCPVYKIPWFSEMCGLQPWIFPPVPYRYQLFL